jgi:Type II CAAX prenyl endopeptidase Rce1-like
VSALVGLSPAFWSYLRTARTPRYSLTFSLPLLAAYETLAFVLSRLEVAEVRSGADVLLKNVFVGLGGRHGLAAFGAVLVGGAVAIIWRDLRRSGQVRPRYFFFMTGESVAYALMFGLVAGSLTQLLLPTMALVVKPAELATGYQARLSLPTQLMISLGAGIYEELLFRVLLVSGLTLVATKVFRWSRTSGVIVAVLLGALIFSVFHYLGPYGEPFAVGSFTFRTIAGLLFSGLYVLRGFGITAWTHALYDIFLALGW